MLFGKLLTANCLNSIKWKQWHQLFHMFYIEPIVFILVFAHSLSGTVFRHETIYLACLNIFHYNSSDCVRLGTADMNSDLQEIEIIVQPYVANLFMVRTLLESIVPAICGIFIGSWSDRYGRKPLLLVSMIGFSFTYAIAVVICELSHVYPVNPWYYVLTVVPHSILGGNCVFTVAAFCFISDITDVKTRPYRMICFEVCLSSGLTLGSLLSSYVYEATNTTITFAISSVLMFGATVFIAVYVPESLNIPIKQNSPAFDVKESKQPAIDVCKQTIDSDKDDKFVEVSLDTMDGSSKENVVEAATVTTSTSKERQADENETKSKPLQSHSQSVGLFNYMHVKEMWITCFKSRPYYNRCIILLVTFSMFLAIFVWDGAITVFYLFSREKFSWSIRDFTLYETINHVINMFGALFGFLILRKIFHLSLVTLALIAFFSDILRNLIFGLSNESWHLYLGTAVGALKSMAGPMCRTIISNIVTPTDLGKIFSIKNILTSLAPFLAAPLYTLIYQSSIRSFPGLFNIISAFLYFIAFIFLMFVLRFKIQHKDYYANLLK